MVQLVLDRGKQPILFNVPHVNEAAFPPSVVEEIHGKRDHHNPRLKAFDDKMKAVGADHMLMIFAGQGHGFGGEHGKKAADATWAFFDQHLKQ